MSRRKRNITTKLRIAGAAWAVRNDKYCSPNDPFQDQTDRRKTYHIHPDIRYPHQSQIIRFDTLDQLEEWLDFCHCGPDDEDHRFSEDGLLEWCNRCGMLVCDHHMRKFGKPHPAL